MVRKLEKRFAPPPKPGHAPSKGITFDRFLMACVTVKHYTESFRRADTRNEGRLTLDYNTFVSVPVPLGASRKVAGTVSFIVGVRNFRQNR